MRVLYKESSFYSIIEEPPKEWFNEDLKMSEKMSKKNLVSNLKSVNKVIKRVRPEIVRIFSLKKVILTPEYNEMFENHYIKLVVARSDLLCANVLYSKTLIQFIDYIKTITNIAEFQIYTDECADLHLKACLSINMYVGDEE